MDLFVASQRAELLDARFDVVSRDPLALVDGIEVNLVDDLAVGLQRAIGNVDAGVALGFEHSDPQTSFENDLVAGRPQLSHLRRGVTRRQIVGDLGSVHVSLTVHPRRGTLPDGQRVAHRSPP